MARQIALLLAAAIRAFGQEYVVEGNPSSTVRVIAYEDLQCSDCATYRKMLDEKLLPKYGKTVAFEHRDYPLPKHKAARPAAIAARHFDALKPELGIAFRRYCFAQLDQTTPENFVEKVRQFASANGADPDKAVAALKSPALAKLVEAEYQEGIARGIARTPTVFVNGEPFIERFTFEEISKSIDAALSATPKNK
jgi:protein-disulfide isomerase